MKFKALQEQLRKAIAKRIDDGELTGVALAEQTGFQQAHISNFLNKKRSLSLEGMDRVLQVQHLSVLDLLDPAEVNKRASIVAPSDDKFENVVLTAPEIAANEPFIQAQKVADILKFKKNFLKRLREDMATNRKEWQRFVLIKVEAHEAMGMYPRLLPGSTVLIDRHYNSLEPYRKGEPNLYAVRFKEGITIRYVEVAGDNLVLRPNNPSYPVAILPIGEERAEAMIVGRVCHVANEL